MKTKQATNPRYLVEIAGAPEALKRLPDLFTGSDFYVTAAPNGRILLSARSFEECNDPKEVIAAASHILRRIMSILQIFGNASNDFTVKNVDWTNDSGRRKRRLTATIHFHIISNTGLEELAASTTNKATLGSELLRLASMDDDVARAFDLIRAKELGWYELYDLIDIMGNVGGIVNRGWATRAVLSSIRQTANHYRHLGSASKSHRLPSNPPHLNNACATITDLFRRWLTERLEKAAKR
jgi:hypothetical protein